MKAIYADMHKSTVSPRQLQQNSLFLPPYASLSPEALRQHFRQRSRDNYFPLKPGKQKHLQAADCILRGEFTLNNETHHLPTNFNWLTNPSQDLEWLILLHKFYYARDLALAYDLSGDDCYARHWVALLSAWIKQVPDGFVNSQVTGRRLQQWLLAYHYFVPGRDCPAISADFLLDFCHSMQSQALFLSQNLTPAGNHRTIELYAIFSVALLFPELRESARLLSFARHELLDNLRHDFLADGVHQELSTDYHHTVLKNFLRVRELADLNQLTLPSEFHDLMRKAMAFSMYAHKPDGWLPAINDGDVNSYLSLLRSAQQFYPNPELAYVLSQGKNGLPPHQRSRLFTDSGYCILRSAWTAQAFADSRYFFFDCGNLGFGSHGHYDLLSFEAAAFGRSLLLDPGRYTYHEDAAVNWRHAFKGTAAHNTVLIDGKDQIDYQCHNPQGPEPTGSVLDYISTPGFDFVRAQALSPQYSVKHLRSVYFAEFDYWIIVDELIDDATHHYQQFFHLAPDAQDHTHKLPEHHGLGIKAPNLLIVQPHNAAISMSSQPGWVSPEYGLKQAAPVICFSQTATGSAGFQTVLYPYAQTPPLLRVKTLAVEAQGQAVDPRLALALSIEIEHDDYCHHDYLFINHGGAATEFNFADISCRASLLFVRRERGGGIISIQSNQIEMLRIADRSLLDCIGSPMRLNFADGQLYLEALTGAAVSL